MPGIALIDDREENIQPLAFIFSRYGVGDISVYSDPFVLLNDMKNGKRPDLVITDFDMPHMNGVELLDTIRQRFCKVAGIILTGNPGAIPRISRLGNKYHILTKGSPGMIGELARLIHDIISLQKGARPATKQDRTLPCIFLERVR